MTTASFGHTILDGVRDQLNLSEYHKIHWEGTFEEYLDTVYKHPQVTRSAYQRLYDMILSHGTDDVYENKDKITRFKFFTDFAARHGDAIYGLDRSLTHLVHTFKSAADLRKLYEQDNSLQKGQETIAYCRIGERSSHTWFVLKFLLGYDARNYDGSWTEYGNAVGVPIVNEAGTVWTGK